MKTVWIVNHYAQSPRGAGGVRHYQLAKGLSRQGWQAYILAASTEHKTGRQRLAPKESSKLEEVGGVPFLWLRTPIYQGNGLGRIRNILTFAARLLGSEPHRFLPKPQVIIGSSVHPFAVWSAYRLAKRYRVPFLFEVRDLWPQTLIDFGLMRDRSLSAQLLRALEGYLYRRSSAIITLLPLASQYIQRFGINPSRIHWIPNGVDLSAWPDPAAPPAGATLQLMYFGAFGQANGLDVLLNAMQELSQRVDAPSVHLRLIGDGPLKANLKRMASNLGLSNISFEDSVPKEQIPATAAEADAFVVSIINSPIYKYGISLNKIFDYMAAARPVIIGSSAANNPIADAKAGITVPPDDPVALADAIMSIARLSVEKRQELGLLGRSYLEQNHDSELLALKLSKILNASLSQMSSKI